jgi:hypothetical protein
MIVHLLIKMGVQSCLKILRLCKPFLAKILPLFRSMNYTVSVDANINCEASTSDTSFSTASIHVVPNAPHDFQDVTRTESKNKATSDANPPEIVQPPSKKQKIITPLLNQYVNTNDCANMCPPSCSYIVTEHILLVHLKSFSNPN